jgi:ABC-type nitrate/sulfonate/bicarbonate transport system ATPase subunit
MNHLYTMKDTLLKVENVNLQYDGKLILRDINLEIHDIVRPELTQGQIVAIIGKSGMGKTQLLKILSGLVIPNSGTVKIDTDQHSVKEGEVGIIFQNYILFNHRTVYKNLEIGVEHSGKKLSMDERKEIIRDYANRFDLIDHLQKYPSQLSGGQKQRVSIIQQVLTGNRFILLDEPFSGLDIIMTDKVIDLLIKVSNTHELNTLIIVSHDIVNAMAISDTAFIVANEEGKFGATITEKIDLMQMGLAWEPDVKQNPCFHKLVAEIKLKI